MGLSDSQSPATEGGRSRAVLLADDNAVVRVATGRLVRLMGREVDTVCDGAEAVAAAARRDYELIMLDIQMPVMGGMEAAAMIRRQSAESQPNLRIVIISADADVLDLDPSAGVECVISKPIRAVDLKHLLDIT